MNDEKNITYQRRMFDAEKHPKHSHERAMLNLSSLTSEYMPSYRYWTSDNRTFRTKAEAVAHCNRKNGVKS